MVDGRTTDGRTTDGRRLDWYTISSPCKPNGSGELKRPNCFREDDVSTQGHIHAYSSGVEHPMRSDFVLHI